MFSTTDNDVANWIGLCLEGSGLDLTLMTNRLNKMMDRKKKQRIKLLKECGKKRILLKEICTDNGKQKKSFKRQ